MATLLLDCLKWRQYPCDFSAPETAAHNQLGWTTHPLRVPVEETALLLMHLWDHGYPGGMVWGPDSPNLGHAQYCEWVGRCRRCFDEAMPPIVAAARAAGVRIIHVASAASYADRYPQYQRTLDEVTTAPPAAPAGAIKRPDIDWFPAELTTGPDFHQDSAGIDYDFPPHLRPTDDDLVVVTTHQLNTLLRNRRIWHLTYTGFAINVCLWHSPAGMFDMKRLGYACGCIREGTVAVETAESAEGERNHQYAMWWTSHHYGFVLAADAYIRACTATSA
jgi:nicotinamidase-related amidase